MSEKELPPLPAGEAEQGYELDLDEYYYGANSQSSSPQKGGGGFLNESASHSAEAAAVVQQEMNNVQALKRLSIGALPTLDPDLPQPLPWEDEFQFEQPEESPEEGADSGGDESQPLSVVSQDHASELLWVPAHVHPEIAPQEWKSFVQNKVAEIRAATVSNIEEQSSESSSDSALSRRNSRLSRQITQDEFRDGSEILQQRRRSSQDSAQSILSLSNQLQQLGELESLAMDPFQLARSLSQVYRHSSLNDQRSSVASTDEGSEGEEGSSSSSTNRRSMSLSATKPLANDSDEPIVAAPSSSLRRATRNRYSKGSIRTRPRRRVGSGLSAVSLNDSKPAESSTNGEPSTKEADEPPNLGKENVEPEIPQRSKSRNQHNSKILEAQRANAEPKEPPFEASKQAIREHDEKPPDHKEPSRYHHKKRPQEVAGPQDDNIASPSLLSSNDTMPIVPLASQPAETPAEKKRPPPITLTPPHGEEKPPVPTPPQSPRVKRKGTWGWLFSNDKDKEKEPSSTTNAPSTTSTNDTNLHQSQLAVASGKPTSPTSPTKSSVDKLLNRSEEDDPAPSVTKSFSSMFSKKKKKDDDDPRKKKAAKASEKKKPSRYRNRKDHEEQTEPVGGVVVSGSGAGDIFDPNRGGPQGGQQKNQLQAQQAQIDLPYHIPEHQMSDKSLVMMYHRYPLHIERAIYRLSHLKLANPRRPLVQQVLLSNFMYAYLNLINHGYQQQQQQMQQMQAYHQYQPQQLQYGGQEYEEAEEHVSSSSSSSSTSPEELWHEFEGQEQHNQQQQQPQRYGYGTTAPIAS